MCFLCNVCLYNVLYMYNTFYTYIDLMPNMNISLQRILFPWLSQPLHSFPIDSLSISYNVYTRIRSSRICKVCRCCRHVYENKFNHHLNLKKCKKSQSSHNDCKIYFPVQRLSPKFGQGVRSQGMLPYILIKIQ